MKECKHEKEHLKCTGKVREDGREVETYYTCTNCGSELTWSYGNWHIEDNLEWSDND